MPIDTRDWYRGPHPIACTCVACGHRRLPQMRSIETAAKPHRARCRCSLCALFKIAEAGPATVAAPGRKPNLAVKTRRWLLGKYRRNVGKIPRLALYGVGLLAASYPIWVGTEVWQVKQAGEAINSGTVLASVEAANGEIKTWLWSFFG